MKHRCFNVSWLDGEVFLGSDCKLSRRYSLSGAFYRYGEQEHGEVYFRFRC